MARWFVIPPVISLVSALWALIALALTAMTTTSTDGFTESVAGLSPSRSSPFTCLADICIIGIWTFYLSYKGYGIVPVARMIRRYFGTEEEESGRMASLAGTILFILGPLPQAIKLISMGGLPWTQAWGISYILSFLMYMAVEALALRHHKKDTHPTHSDIEFSRLDKLTEHSDHSHSNSVSGRLDEIASSTIENRHVAEQSESLDQEPFARVASKLQEWKLVHKLAHLIQFGIWTWISFKLLLLPYDVLPSPNPKFFYVLDGVMIGCKLFMVTTIGLAVYFVLQRIRSMLQDVFKFQPTSLFSTVSVFWWMILYVWLSPLQESSPRFTIFYTKFNGIWYKQVLFGHQSISISLWDAWALMFTVATWCLVAVAALDSMLQLFSRKLRKVHPDPADRVLAMIIAVVLLGLSVVR
ncbi:MAG: hypothetical protein MMC33_006083 [Icmadophila ericetorum]|nr:hypothetical protein [Icmadophila ericetorum]